MRQARLSIPKGRSPGKTFLNSPARHNPHIGRTSSPIRGSVTEDVERSSPAKPAKRRLDFSKDPKIRPATNGSSQGHANGASQRALNQNSKASRINGHAPDESDDGSDDEPVIRPFKGGSPSFEQDEEEEDDDDDEPMEFLNAGGDDLDLPIDDEHQQEQYEEPEAEEEDEEESEEEPVPVEQPQPKKRGRKLKAPSPPAEEDSEPEPEAEADPEPQEVEEPAKKKRGRPGKRSSIEDAEPAKPAKRPRGRPSLNKDKDQTSNSAVTSTAAEARGSKKPKTSPKPTAKETKAESSKTAAPKEKGKPGRKRKSSAVGAESPVAPSRPPMPKGRGLVSQRRDNFEVRTTRSGRVSTKPMEFWRGERYIYDEADDDGDVVEDKQGRHIKVGRKIKGVVRIEYDEEEKPKRRRGRPASGRPKRRISEVQEEEEDREEWEDDPGRVVGECIYWYPEHEFNPPQEEDQVEVAEIELAISQAAIQMKDIKDATFRFAKTLTLPFFGSGIVDLPPHAEKRTKNARKMQMVFFVHYGSVEVTVASTVFRITTGGTWFVPRGMLTTAKHNAGNDMLT